VDGMPVGARFSALVQTGCGATQTLVQWEMGVKQSGRGFDHLPHLEPRIMKKYSHVFTLCLCFHGLF